MSARDRDGIIVTQFVGELAQLALVKAAEIFGGSTTLIEQRPFEI